MKILKSSDKQREKVDNLIRDPGIRPIILEFFGEGGVPAGLTAQQIEQCLDLHSLRRRVSGKLPNLLTQSPMTRKSFIQGMNELIDLIQSQMVGQWKIQAVKDIGIGMKFIRLADITVHSEKWSSGIPLYIKRSYDESSEEVTAAYVDDGFQRPLPAHEKVIVVTLTRQ